MSQKRKKNRPSQPSKTSPTSILPQTANPPSSEMNGNERIIEISDTTSLEPDPQSLFENYPVGASRLSRVWMEAM